MSTYTIGEVAERTGFTASALRYYGRRGLLEPSTRTDAGYRLYNEEALARLAFIARAKQLGCSLDEISDLVALWDGERCGPVQRRFHDLVTAKIDAAQHQIASSPHSRASSSTPPRSSRARRRTDRAVKGALAFPPRVSSSCKARSPTDRLHVACGRSVRSALDMGDRAADQRSSSAPARAQEHCG